MIPRDEVYWSVPYSTTRMGLGDDARGNITGDSEVERQLDWGIDVIQQYSLRTADYLQQFPTIQVMQT